jgi:hypothetical protein
MRRCRGGSDELPPEGRSVHRRRLPLVRSYVSLDGSSARRARIPDDWTKNLSRKQVAGRCSFGVRASVLCRIIPSTTGWVAIFFATGRKEIATLQKPAKNSTCRGRMDGPSAGPRAATACTGYEHRSDEDERTNSPRALRISAYGGVCDSADQGAAGVGDGAGEPVEVRARAASRRNACPGDDKWQGATCSLPLLMYSAPGGLRQDPGRIAESSGRSQNRRMWEVANA